MYTPSALVYLGCAENEKGTAYVVLASSRIIEPPNFSWELRMPLCCVVLYTILCMARYTPCTPPLRNVKKQLQVGPYTSSPL